MARPTYWEQFTLLLLSGLYEAKYSDYRECSLCKLANQPTNISGWVITNRRDGCCQQFSGLVDWWRCSHCLYLVFSWNRFAWSLATSAAQKPGVPHKSLHQFLQQLPWSARGHGVMGNRMPLKRTVCEWLKLGLWYEKGFSSTELASIVRIVPYRSLW